MLALDLNVCHYKSLSLIHRQHDRRGSSGHSGCGPAINKALASSVRRASHPHPEAVSRGIVGCRVWYLMSHSLVHHGLLTGCHDLHQEVSPYLLSIHHDLFTGSFDLYQLMNF
jgi:hypothetical protein